MVSDSSQGINNMHSLEYNQNTHPFVIWIFEILTEILTIRINCFTMNRCSRMEPPFDTEGSHTVVHDVQPVYNERMFSW